MVFLVLFAVKTGYLLGTDSLSGHRKETGEKKRGSPTSLTTGYPKTTLISWYVDCNTLIIWSNYSATSPKEAREKWLQICWDFVKQVWMMKWLGNIFFPTAVQKFFLFHLCCMHFFSSDKRFQEIVLQNHPLPTPLKSS